MINWTKQDGKELPRKFLYSVLCNILGEKKKKIPTFSVSPLRPNHSNIVLGKRTKQEQLQTHQFICLVSDFD